MSSGVYTITNMVNGKQYVGSSGDIERRWTIHKGKLRAGTADSYKLQRDWSQYGEDAFQFLVMEEVQDTDRLREREKWFMEQLRPAYNVMPIRGVPLANLTMAWPIKQRKAIDAAAEQEGKTRTEFVLDELMRHPAVRKYMETEAKGEAAE